MKGIPLFRFSWPRSSATALACAAFVASAAAQTFVGSDNFDDNSRNSSNWTISFATNSNLTETNGRVEFTSTSASGQPQAGWHWNPLLTSVGWTSGWQATVDTTNLWAGGTNSADARLYLQIYDPSNTTTPFPNFCISLRTVTDGVGTVSHLVRSINYYGATPDLALVSDFATNATSAQLRITFDPTTKIATTAYSFDSGATFTDLQSADLDSGGTPWPSANQSSIAANGFGFNIFGLATATTIPAGQLYFDNFSVTAIPEPSTHASLAGIALLGYAWLRRARGRV